MFSSREHLPPSTYVVHKRITHLTEPAEGSVTMLKILEEANREALATFLWPAGYSAALAQAAATPPPELDPDTYSDALSSLAGWPTDQELFCDASSRPASPLARVEPQPTAAGPARRLRRLSGRCLTPTPGGSPVAGRRLRPPVTDAELGRGCTPPPSCRLSVQPAAAAGSHRRRSSAQLELLMVFGGTEPAVGQQQQQEEEPADCYPNCDLSIWMRSCDKEQIEPLQGEITGQSIMPR